ncbi:MAG: MFS transporter [Burkholderiaceae bacterium]
MPASPLDSVASNADPAAARRAWHLAIRAQFLVLGLAMGAWGAQVPSVKSHYGLNERALSIALLAAAAGAVLCLFSAGRLVARFGARHCIQAAGLLMLASLLAVLQSQAYAVLLVLMLLFGASGALFDVAINAEGNTLEAQGERKVMSGLHAMFSLGGMAGALVCSGLHRLAVPASLQLTAISLAIVPALLWAGARASGRHAPGDEAQAPIAWPRGALLWVGLLTALCMVAEGAMYDWSALFVRQELRTSEATGALGFAAFSAAMAAGRLVGDRVRERFVTLMLLRGSGVLAASGMALALSVGAPWAALLGFMLVGLGLANVVPVLYSAAAQVPGVSAAAGVAAVSSIGYMGFMVGPPMIGALASATSLGTALWAVALFAVLMALAAPLVAGPRVK